MKTLSVVVVCAVLAAPVSAAPRLKIYVSQIERAEVIVQAIVPREAENRALEVVAESEEFYRSSTIQLDGDQAPRLSVVSFSRVPSGTYEVTVHVLDADGHRRAQAFKWVTVW